MEQGENFKREGLPALQQVYYLMELERLGKNGKKRGSVTRIAKTWRSTQKFCEPLF